jgi:hypothetical protein
LKSSGSNLLKRFPTIGQVVPVYAVAVMVLYGWTILWFFWKVPGWLFHQTIGEVLVVLAYALFTNFLESLIVAGLPVLVAGILPRRWLADGFAARGMVLIVPVLGYMILLAYQFQDKSGYPSWLLDWAPLAVLLSLLLVFAVARITVLRRAFEWFGDRATVFLYISIPASLVALVVVIIRVVYFAFEGAG